MSVLSPSADAAVAGANSSLVKDLVSLTKPRLSGLVLFTTVGGLWLSGQSVSWLTWGLTLLGTALTVGAANALNCYLERDSDRFMARTAGRPLPTGRLESWVAVAFAGICTAVALPLLTFGVNSLTGLLAALALFSYVLVYTPLKARTHWAMVAGAVPGALPPLMGFTAATGHVGGPGLGLFAILFFWQLPHFIAIALFRKAEYRAAGLTSLPLQHGDVVARWVALGYAIALAISCAAPVVTGVAGAVYASAAVILNGGLLMLILRGVRRGDVTWARRLFAATLVFLTGLFVALGVDRAVR